MKKKMPQIKDLLAGKKILLKGLIGKNDKPYDLYLKSTGIEELTQFNW